MKPQHNPAITIPEFLVLPPEVKTEVYRNALGRLRFLDSLVSIGEGPEEMACEVRITANKLAVLFFGYLMEKGITSGTEVLTQMIPPLMDDIYLPPPPHRPSTLAKASKRVLGISISMTDMAVSQEQWDSGVNPFDGIFHFYRFLEELGYPANVERRSRALAELKCSIKKRPCCPPQVGQALTQ